jgi:hypothetical protein
MIRSSSLIARSISVYDAALRLYPRSFRREFGPPMRDAFGRWLADEASERGAPGMLAVWRVTARELLPTLLREHGSETASLIAAFLASHPIRHVARVALACLIPLAACFAFLHLGRSPADLAVTSFWFALTAAGMARARGQGWACSRNAMIGSAAGIGFPLAWTALMDNPSPNFVAVAPLLIAAAVTVGLFLSSSVRLIIEGVTCVAPVRVPTGRLCG